MKQKPINFITFIAPTMILFLLIFAVPLTVLFVTSLCDWRTGGSITFVGIENYVSLVKDETFRQAFLNNVVWILLQSTIHIVIGVVFGLILAKRPFFWKFARTAYMIPSIISSAAMGMLFLCIFNPEFGMVNSVVRLFVPDYSQNWFMDFSTAFFTVTMTWLPYAAITTLLVLTEIMSIDRSVLEAAIIDGANDWQLDMKIILPLLKNIIGTSVILEATGMLKKMDIIMLTTRGGPGSTTMNMPYFVYKTSMVENNFGLANAAGVLLILLGIATVQIINRIFAVGEGNE